MRNECTIASTKNMLLAQFDAMTTEDQAMFVAAAAVVNVETGHFCVNCGQDTYGVRKDSNSEWQAALCSLCREHPELDLE